MLKIDRRTLLKSTLAAGLAGSGLAGAAARAAGKNELVFVGFGGTYQEQQTKALFQPFEKETGIKIVQTTGVDLAKLRAQVRSGNVEWDMLLMSDRDRYTAMNDGLLTRLDYKVIDTTDIPKDVITEYSIGGLSIPMQLTYSTAAFPAGKPAPQTAADFWDVQKFPGRRGLYNSPVYALEFALLADGVPKDKLYPLDLDRAFKSLDRLAAATRIVWWTQFGQPGVMLKSGEIAMTYWSRSTAQIQAGDPLGISYDGACLLYSSWVVPRGAPNAEGAMKFINFALQPKPLGDLATLTTFSPTNPKAMAHVAEAVKPLLAGNPDQRAKTFALDAEWWGKNLDKTTERWNEWRLK